jgi:predicted HicB family RNase H-like nuclease
MIEYKGYIGGRVEFDDNADIFHGEVINIRDVITFQGRSTDELRQALHDSVEVYLSFCAEHGKKPDKPFSGELLVHLTPEQHRKIFAAAQQAGEELDKWVIHVLENEISHQTTHH